MLFSRFFHASPEGTGRRSTLFNGGGGQGEQKQLREEKDFYSTILVAHSRTNFSPARADVSLILL
jgi:hypothetical protein